MSESERFYKESLVNRLNYLENYYADSILSEDLKHVYEEIQMKCADFRENIFFKNIAILENNLGKSQIKQPNSSKNYDIEHIEQLKAIKSYDELLKLYEEKEF